MELVLRIIVDTSNSGGRVITVEPGGSTMPAPKTEPSLRELYDQYIAWGTVMGGRTPGDPWSHDHLRQTTKRCLWWIEKLEHERAGLGSLQLLLVERLAQVVGRRFDRRGKVIPVAPKTRKDYIGALLAWRTWAEGRDLIRIPVPDPLRALRKPSGDPETEWRGLTADEFRRLLDVAPLVRRRIYAVMALTSLRRRELRDLKVKFFDAPNSRFVIPPKGNKNGKPSIVPIAPQIFEIVEAWAKGKDGEDELIRFSKDALTRAYNADCDTAGIVRESPEGKAQLHGMRDTASTVLQQLGYGLSLASKFNRHGDERITRKRYTNISAAEVAGAAAALGDHLLGVRGMAVNVRGTQSDPTLSDPSAQANPIPDQDVQDQNGGRRGTRTPLEQPIIIVNVMAPSGSTFPHEKGTEFGLVVNELWRAWASMDEAGRAEFVQRMGLAAAVPPIAEGGA